MSLTEKAIERFIENLRKAERSLDAIGGIPADKYLRIIHAIEQLNCRFIPGCAALKTEKKPTHVSFEVALPGIEAFWPLPRLFLLSSRVRTSSPGWSSAGTESAKGLPEMFGTTPPLAKCISLPWIRKGKARRYVEKSQWAFYQLEQFILYKSILSGIPVFYVNPRNTSKECSSCGTINTPNGKHYKCSNCGHVQHRDVNAAFNIAQRFLCENGIPSAFAVSPIGGAYATRGTTGQTLLHVESSGGAR